jgi:hypothetical protein
MLPFFVIAFFTRTGNSTSFYKIRVCVDEREIRYISGKGGRSVKLTTLHPECVELLLYVFSWRGA